MSDKSQEPCSQEYQTVFAFEKQGGDVEENFVFGDEFALGLSISVLDMISSRIRHFKT
jgi:hypothetical protein